MTMSREDVARIVLEEASGRADAPRVADVARVEVAR